MNLQEIQFPKNHRETALRFLAACQSDDRIVAAFIGGSYARGEVDKHSDLDLFFITTDEAYEHFLAEKESFVHQLGEPLFLEDFGVPHGYCFIFSNTTEGEFWFGRESKFKDIYSGPYKVLFDKKNILTGEVFPTHIADRTRQIELLHRQIDWFWHELSHFIKAMGRKQLWFAYGQIEAMRRICTILARLKHNFSDTYLEEGEPYFKIEQALPVEELSPLQTTFCSMEYDAMLQAALVICRFYQNVAPGLAEAHNLSYQTDLEQIMISQLKELSHAS
ncbi:MAG TPA: aminoglycoside 6-adenylyltransferase [Anaerolineales bacterium]|nr:aminoglycoside 6-adenylyltransferase [Anaerolineales bacterium]